MSLEGSALCFGCGHDRILHHTYGCDGNLGAQQRFWSTFEELPGYDQTRDVVVAQESQQPQACVCTTSTFKG